MKRKTTEERFWPKVQRCESNQCWPWIGAKNTDGRGQFYFNGRYERAYRIAWLLTHGHMPQRPLIICHRCDNPNCVNPAHLFVGTYRDNSIDMVQKGRDKNQNKGKSHCHKGHALDGDNLLLRTNGQRGCRECNREAQAKFRKLHRDRLLAANAERARRWLVNNRDKKAAYDKARRQKCAAIAG